MKPVTGANMENSLWDRLVCGIRSDQAQKHLLTEMALAMEMAIKDTNKLQGANGGAANVNKMHKSGNRKQC